MSNEFKAKPTIVREGLYGLVVAGLAASFSITSIMTQIYMAKSSATLGSGGQAFSANMNHVGHSLLSFSLSGLAVLVSACSIWFSDKIFPKSLTFYHFCTLIFLAPSAFLLITMFIR